MKNLDKSIIDQALGLLNDLLEAEDCGQYSLVVCGGASLIFTGLVARTTHDVDVLAVMSGSSELVSPAPLPEVLVEQAGRVAATLGISDDWLNNGPSSDDGGLFQMGLPNGIQDRLTEHVYGVALAVHYVSRIDQIFFKLYAAADQGPGRHVNDLFALEPSTEEIKAAVVWARSHDPSEGFRIVLTDMLNVLGFVDVIE